MQLTIFSILMSVLTSAVLIMLAILLSKWTGFLTRFGPKVSLALLGLAAIRLYFPFEFPFTKAVEVQSILNPVNDVLSFPVEIAFIPTKISVITIVTTILVIIALIRITKFLMTLYQCLKDFGNFGQTSDKSTMQIARKIISEKDLSHIKIAKSSEVKIPYSFGFKHYIIVLPDEQVSSKELSYIIKHEYAHIKHHDTWFLLFIEILSCLYWWNPFVYLLKSRWKHLSDISSDIAVIDGMSKAERKSYTDILYKYEERACSGEIRNSFHSNFAGDTAALQRFSVLTKFAWSTKGKVVFAGILMLLPLYMIFSYSLVFQSAYEADVPGLVTSKDMSVVPNSDGTFTVSSGGKTFVIPEEEMQFLSSSVNIN